MALIRSGQSGDAEAFLELRGEIFPHLVNTADGIRYRWATRAAPRRELMLAAEEGGRLVGWVTCGLNIRADEPGAGTAQVLVRPDHRRRGIGTELLAAAETHLRGLGVRRVRGTAGDDPGTLDFLRGRGFEQGHHQRFSGLSLAGGAALPPMPPVPPGVTTASLAQLGPEASYEVHSRASLDEPGDVPPVPIEYQDWLTSLWHTPELRHDLSVGVLVDGVPAALTLVEADPAAGRCWSGGTDTLARYRGRGLAKLAKSVALRRAAEAGITVAYAANDYVNAPMLAVNDWLGYRPVASVWSVLKAL